MPNPSRCARVLAGWFLAAGLAGVAHGQYQDVTSESAATLNNNRSQSNLSDQGTGYSSSQLGLYGPYYNWQLNRQNNVNNSAPLRPGAVREPGQRYGLPNSGLPLTGEQMNAQMVPLERTQRALSADALGLTLSESDGQLLVMRVRDGSAMARAGLKAGDRIEIVNGKTVRSPEAFQQALEALTVGREVPIVVVRSEHGEVLKWIPRAEELELPLSEAAAVEPRREAHESNPFHHGRAIGLGPGGQAFLGVELDPDVSHEVIVQAVVAGSPAQTAGLRPGDRIYALSGLNLRSPQDLVQILARDRPGTAVYLYVGRSMLPAASRSDRHEQLPPPVERTPPVNVSQPADGPRLAP